jgi:hypothetical protein
MNLDKLKQAVTEYKTGQRVLVQEGAWHITQGFTVFPKTLEDYSFDKPGDRTRIYRKVTIPEAKDLARSPHCRNKEAMAAFFHELEATHG